MTEKFMASLQIDCDQVENKQHTDATDADEVKSDSSLSSDPAGRSF
jgi:hypothetical protein